MNRPLILGVLNVTPDSFSDGGRYDTVDRAVQHARRLVREGADVLDVGGESTRPGAERVEQAEEQRRVLPVVEALVAEGVAVSVDTMNAGTARAAVAAGATIVNDVSGGLADEGMAAVVAESDARYVLMHWRGHSDVMTSLAHYGDVVEDVRRELDARVAEVRAEGVREEQIVLDPGLGFAKNAEHNWTLLRHLDRLRSLGYPVLVGASRKRFLGALPERGRVGVDDHERDLPTAVVSALAAGAGAWGVRVHDVASTATALDVVDAWEARA